MVSSFRDAIFGGQGSFWHRAAVCPASLPEQYRMCKDTANELKAWTFNIKQVTSKNTQKWLTSNC